MHPSPSPLVVAFGLMSLSLPLVGACRCPGHRDVSQAPLAADPLLDGVPKPVPQKARPGAAGAGDPYYPEAGNGGTDALLYDLELAVDMDSGALVARAAIDLVALESLSDFNLDLVGLEVDAVRVNGEPASFQRTDHELVITPPAPLSAGEEFRCEVEYRGVPSLAPDASLASMGIPGVGWWRMDSGVYTVSECVGSPSWFPCNDHPRDKARLRLKVTVEEPWVVAANGLLEEVVESTGPEGEQLRSYTFEVRDPMATYLATVNIAKFEVLHEEGPDGLPLTHYLPEDATDKELAAFARTGEMISYFAELFGPYPFECFGGILSYEQIGGALETQTIPIYSRGVREGTVAHELAHQWFGDAVSVDLWQDLWLNEGFASYCEWLWLEHTDGREALEKRARRIHRFLLRRKVGPPFDTGVDQLWGARAYQRGAWVLHALRLEMGDEDFFLLCQRWVADNLHANGSTSDFIALATEVEGRDLTEFFDAWLFADVLPELEAESEEAGG